MSSHTKTEPVITAMVDKETDLSTESGQIVTDTDPLAKRPIPRWLLLNAFLLALVGVSSILMFSNAFKTKPTVVKNYDSLAALLDSALPVSSSVNKISVDQSLTPLPQEPVLNETVSNSQGQLIPLKSSIEDPKVTQLEAKLAQLTALVQTQQQAFESEKQSVATQFKALSEQLNALKKQAVSKPVVNTTSQLTRIKPKELPKTKTSPLAVSKRVTPPTKLPLAKQVPVLAAKRELTSNPKDKGIRQRSVIPTQSKSSMPPFSLVSIDHWGNEMHAVVRYQGQLHTLTPGSSLMDWKVDGLNEAGEGVYVVSSAGRRSLLTLD